MIAIWLELGDVPSTSPSCRETASDWRSQMRFSVVIRRLLDFGGGKGISHELFRNVHLEFGDIVIPKLDVAG